MSDRPILYSFRRCPYAMRARLAVAYAGVEVELREVLLRDKAPEFLAASPSATVPCLVDGAIVIDESYDIMLWALAKNDPQGWLDMPELGQALIATADGPFKTSLDRYKYASRHDADPRSERDKGGAFLMEINALLQGNRWIFGKDPSLADMAILPFVRQFAHVDLAWFDTQPWGEVSRWLGGFKSSGAFADIMMKYPKWQNGDEPTLFGA